MEIISRKEVTLPSGHKEVDTWYKKGEWHCRETRYFPASLEILASKTINKHTEKYKDLNTYHLPKVLKNELKETWVEDKIYCYENLGPRICVTFSMFAVPGVHIHPDVYVALFTNNVSIDEDPDKKWWFWEVWNTYGPEGVENRHALCMSCVSKFRYIPKDAIEAEYDFQYQRRRVATLMTTREIYDELDVLNNYCRCCKYGTLFHIAEEPEWERDFLEDSDSE